MGNCLVVQDKAIKIARTDGKVFEYKPPMQVDQILREFSGHALSNSFSHPQHLEPDAKLLGGRLYYLVPHPLLSLKEKKKKKEKKVRFANPEVEDKLVRIKVVMGKQELQKLLQGESSSVQGVVSQKLHERGLTDASDLECNGRKPELESIHEID